MLNATTCVLGIETPEAVGGAVLVEEGLHERLSLKLSRATPCELHGDEWSGKKKPTTYNHAELPYQDV
jgi:hypothetical protein